MHNSQILKTRTTPRTNLRRVIYFKTLKIQAWKLMPRSYPGLLRWTVPQCATSSLLHKTNVKKGNIHKIYTENTSKTVKTGRRDTKSLSHIQSQVNAIANTDKKNYMVLPELTQRIKTSNGLLKKVLSRKNKRTFQIQEQHVLGL